VRLLLFGTGVIINMEFGISLLLNLNLYIIQVFIITKLLLLDMLLNIGLLRTVGEETGVLVDICY